MLTTSFFHTQLQKNEIIKDVSQDKVTGTYKIPPKIIKLSAKVIDSLSTNIINKNIDNNPFSENAEITSVGPILKQEKDKK